MVVRDRPLGIMTATVEWQANLAIFTSILAHRDEIERLKGITRMSTYIYTPRTFAKYNWRTHFYPIPFYYNNQFHIAQK